MADKDEIKRLRDLITRGKDFIEEDIDMHYNLPSYQKWLEEMKSRN